MIQNVAALRSERTHREDELVEIFLHCARRGDGLHRQILGRFHHRQPTWDALSIRNIFHQYVGLLVDWLLAHAFDAADGMESGMEISGAHRLSRRLQYIFLV